MKDFSSTDIGMNFHSNITKNIRINLYSYLLDEKFNSEYSMLNYYGDIFSYSKRNFNIINYEFNTEIYNLKINNGSDFSKTKFIFGNYDNIQDERQIYTSVDNRVTVNSNLLFQFGISDDYSRQLFKNTIPVNPLSVFPNDPVLSYTYNTSNHNIESYIYLKASIKKLILGLGMRKNIPIEDQKNYFSYQGNLKYNLNNINSFLFSFGKYHGYSIPNTIIEDFYSIYSEQLSFEYQLNGESIDMGFSIYSKKENQPLFFTELGSIKETNIYIKGLEISCEYSLKRFKLSSSYTYLDSKFNYGDGYYKSANKMDYLLKGTLGYYNEKLINISTGVTFRPGLYYTPILNAVYDGELNNYKPIYGGINSTRYNSYSCIDISVNKLFEYKNANMVFFTTLTNILNTDNQQKTIYTKNYESQGNWRYMKRILYFGIIINL